MKAGWVLVVALAEVAVVGACARPASVTPARLGARVEPDIRVGLEIGVPEVRVGGHGLIVGFSHGTVVVRGPARLVPDGRALRLASGLSNERFERLTFVSRTPGRFVTVNGRPFRGAVRGHCRTA